MSDGVVVSLWRYPVKSMQGEEINGAAITERGVVGDRGYALRDRGTGHIASAKHPRKWGRLFDCRAAFVEPPQVDRPLPPVWITLPDGTVIHSAQPDIDQILSCLLERDVTLVTETPAPPTREANRTPVEEMESAETITQEPMSIASPPGTFFDYAPLHLLTTATLDRLRELYPAGRFETRRFRPNIVIAPMDSTPGFIENGWPGRTLQIGDEVRLKLIDPSPRCIITTLAQSDLPRDTGILRTIAQHSSAPSTTIAPGVVFPAVAGIYATTLQVGWIRRGATLRLE